MSDWQSRFSSDIEPRRSLRERLDNPYLVISEDNSSVDSASSPSTYGRKRPRKTKAAKRKATKRRKSNRKDSSSDEGPFYVVNRSSLRERSDITYAHDTSSGDDESLEDCDTLSSEYSVDEATVNFKSRSIESLSSIIEYPGEDVIEQILDCKEKDSESLFLVKWVGKSHIHSTWELESTLLELKGYRRLLNFQKEQKSLQHWLKTSATDEEKEIWSINNELDKKAREDFTHVERILSIRTDSSTGLDEYLVKWKSISYSGCTWELAISIAPYQDCIDDFLERRRCKKSNASAGTKRPDLLPLDHQPGWISHQMTQNGISLELRDYQLAGLNWLRERWSEKKNVILADEMGLGKTIQSVTFLGSLRIECGISGPYLVVVPLSTIAAWKREFKKWCPFLNVVTYRGDRASRAICREFEFKSEVSPKIAKFDVLLTTFELVRRDKEYIIPFTFKSLLVDEAHRLKDSESSLYQDLCTFKTEHILLITGTPLQNSIKELWCLLHFLDRKEFSFLSSFEEEFGEVAKGTNIAAIHGILKPRLLRRVKHDVEKSLPQKREMILRVGMTDMQKRYYRLIVTRNFKELNRGIKGNQFSLMNIVMELKKCCNHPFLFQNAEEKADNKAAELSGLIHNSGKMILLDKLLVRLKETNHRVLIFSQMVRMLDILHDYLQLKGISHQRLDGTMNSEERQIALDRFNSPTSEDFCFLLSTRAGGLGINLATADTVIIFDSDWNPQNDLQAEARAHRIGQKNAVNIYRLVTQDSVEEEILRRAKEKLILDHLIIQRMDSSGSSAPLTSKTKKKSIFDKNDVAKILQFGAKELFKEEDTETVGKSDESIDDILARAEVTDGDHEKRSLADDFLSAFKYTSFPTQASKPLDDSSEYDPEFWKKVVPQHLIPHEQSHQPGDIKAYVPRKAASTVSSYSETIIFAAQQQAEPTVKKKKTTKKNSLPSLDKQNALLYKSILKFGNTEPCMKALMASSLSVLGEEKCKECIEKMIQAARDAKMMNDTEETVFTYRGSEFQAPQLLSKVAEMEILEKEIRKDQIGSLSFRIKFKVSPPTNWSVFWGVKEDSMLLLGYYLHGSRAWDAILDDPTLELPQIDPKIVNTRKISSRCNMLLKKLSTLSVDKTDAPAKQLRQKLKKKNPPSQSSPSKQRNRKSFSKKTLVQCKKQLECAKLELKTLMKLDTQLREAVVSSDAFLNTLIIIGDIIITNVSKESVAEGVDLESHYWHFIHLLTPSVSESELKKLYQSQKRKNQIQ